VLFRSSAAVRVLRRSSAVCADSGFCREELLAWCENNDVDYVFGFARNQRLRRIIGRAMQQAKQELRRTGKPARVFCEFAYRTKKSWSRARRIWVRYSSAYPWQNVFAAAWTALRC
jgi:hypothetical protein